MPILPFDAVERLNTNQLFSVSSQQTCIRVRKEIQYSRNADERSGSQVVHPVFFFQTVCYKSVARDCQTLIIINHVKLFCFKEAVKKPKKSDAICSVLLYNLRVYLILYNVLRCNSSLLYPKHCIKRFTSHSFEIQKHKHNKLRYTANRQPSIDTSLLNFFYLKEIQNKIKRYFSSI